MPSGQCYLIAVYLLVWKEYSHTRPVVLKEGEGDGGVRVRRKFYIVQKHYTLLATVAEFGPILFLQVKEPLLLVNSEIDCF